MMLVLVIITAMVSIQVGASLAKELFPIVGPLPITMLRITLAALVLNLLWRPWRKKVPQDSLKPIFLYGICLGIMNLTFYLSLMRIPLGICVAIEFLGPLSVAIYTSQRKLDLLWVLLAALGIILILPLSASSDKLDPLGIGLAFVAGICWGLYILLSKSVGRTISSGTATSLGMLVAAIIIFPFGVSATGFQDINPDVLKMSLAVAVLSSAIPYSLEMVVMQKMETKTFGILMSLEPAVAAIAGLIMLGEFLTPVQWLAIFLIMFASLGTTMTSRRSKDPRPKSGVEVELFSKAQHYENHERFSRKRNHKVQSWRNSV